MPLTSCTAAKRLASGDCEAANAAHSHLSSWCTGSKLAVKVEFPDSPIDDSLVQRLCSSQLVHSGHGEGRHTAALCGTTRLMRGRKAHLNWLTSKYLAVSSSGAFITRLRCWRSMDTCQVRAGNDEPLLCSTYLCWSVVM